MNQNCRNLNQLLLVVDRAPARALEDPSTASGAVECVFRNVKERLITEIQKWSFAVGCVAWMTDLDILSALAKIDCQIVVQKEDFLRPDRAHKTQLRRAYDRLNCHQTRFDMPGRLNSCSFSGDPSVAAVRCLGTHNKDRKPAHPRTHHKFLVFGDFAGSRGDGAPCLYRPHAVWTGSFNFTNNGTMSLENAVIISDAVIANAYMQEWSQLCALSEPLDWETPWCEPEWRIGT